MRARHSPLPIAGYDGVLEPGTVLCVESYVGELGGHEGVKLEEQVLVTESSPKVLSSFPLDLQPAQMRA